MAENNQHQTVPGDTKKREIAVITTGGKQYKVVPGSEVLVERLQRREGERLTFRDLLAGCQVFAKVLGEEKAKKIRVFKYKPKKRYRRTRGHRQIQTRLLIEKIE